MSSVCADAPASCTPVSPHFCASAIAACTSDFTSSRVGARDDAFDEPLRVVDEHAGWRAVGGALDVAAVGVLRRAVTLGGLHRGGVREPGVSVDARQVDGIVRNGGGELLVRREARVAPVVLVPAAADDPLARRASSSRARRRAR